MPLRKRKRTTKKKSVNKNFGDVPVDYAKPESVVDAAPTPIILDDFIIPDGVIELSNGCLVKTIGRTDGEKIKYQKGWRQDSGLIEWTPPSSMLKDMFSKYVKNMEVKK